MPEVAIIADTHVPSRAEGVPEWVEERVERADHAIHAGDFESEETLDRVRDLADGNLTAVTGNMDSGLGLPTVETLDVGGVRFVVTHGTGDVAGYEERVVGIVREHAADGPTVGVSGHTHELLDTEVEGVRVLNPASATGAAPASTTSMVTATVADGAIEVTIHEQ